MSKVAFIADIHLGIKNRQDDILNALKVVIDYCKANNISTIFTLGDLFHDRSSLPIDTICETIKIFEYAKSLGQHWIAFPGNHDMFLKHSWELTSIKPLSHLMTIIDDVKIVKVDKSRFWILPFVYSERAYMRILRLIEEYYENNDVLLTHIGVCNAISNVCFLLQHWGMVDFTRTKFNRIYAGHYHIHQQVGSNMWYIGSLIPFKFDEGDSNHGIVLYDLETRKHELIDIWDIWEQYSNKPKPPQFHMLHDSLLDNNDEVVNNNIKIVLSKCLSQNEKQEIRDKLIKKGAKLVTFTDPVLNTSSELKSDNQNSTIKTNKLFEYWFDNDKNGVLGLNRNLAFRLNREIIEEAEDRIKQDIN